MSYVAGSLICFMYEVIAIRQGWLMLGKHDFSVGEMGEIISFMVT